MQLLSLVSPLVSCLVAETINNGFSSIVGHNGVINNYKELIDIHLPDWWCDVDTSVISGLLEMYIATRHTTPEIDSIVERVLNMLQGTYGLFIYNKPMSLFQKDVMFLE